MTSPRAIRPDAPAGQLSIDDLEFVVGGNLVSSLRLMGEMLSNVSKTRSEISMTFARNARA